MAAEEDKGTEKNRKPEEVPPAPVAPAPVTPAPAAPAPVTPVAPPAAAPGWVVPPSLRRAPLVPGARPGPAAGRRSGPAAPWSLRHRRRRPRPPPLADPPPAPGNEAAADRAPSEPHLDRIDPPALDEGARAAGGIEPQLGPAPVPPDPAKSKRWSKLPPPLMARTTDRLIDEGEKPRRYGAWVVLGVLILLGAGGFWLWRQGRLDPILTPAHNLIAKIESYFPGTEPETPTASTSGGTTSQRHGWPGNRHQHGTATSTGAAPAAAPPDAAMVQEIKQLLAKLDLSPGPIDGNLDQATQDAIRSYQEMAGEPVNGQPSQALLNDLRVVVAYQQPPG